MKRLRQAAVAATALLLSACSAQVFEKETEAFASAASGVEEVWTTVYDRIDAAEQEERDRIRVRENWAFEVSRGCRQLARDPDALADPIATELDADALKAEIARRNALIDACFLTERRPGVTPDTARTVVATQADRGALALGRVITEYAEALAELTTAQDPGELRSAAASMGATLGKASGKIGPDVGLEVDLSGPLGLLASIYGELRLASIEQAKYRTLRRVVRQMDAPVQRITARLAEIEPVLRADLLDTQSDALRQAVRDLRGLKPSASRTERALRQQAAIDRLAEYKAYARTLARGGISYRSVGTAHAALADAIEDPDRFELAKKAVELIKDMGESLKDASEALAKDLEAELNTGGEPNR